MTAPTSDLEDTPALFVEEGDSLVPTASAVGPWRPDALHGAAVGALFGALLDRPDRTVARITVDLTSALPCVPLQVERTELEGGRRVQRQSATLLNGDREVARATALYVATTELDLVPKAGTVAPPPAELAPLSESRTGWAGFENRAMALHTTGEDEHTMWGWFRLLVPAVAGGPVTGLQAALAAADYTSGATAMVLSLKRWSFASLDLTVNLTRRPEGDWVGLRADRGLVGTEGSGAAGSTLHDERGTFGLCTMSQFIQPLPPAGP